jgi:GNAT superfamily N-acetyltransferase
LLKIDEALEGFARGFCFTRSFTHPYVPEKIGRVWVVRDAPRQSGDYRGEEYILHGLTAKEVDRMARKHTRGRFSVCALSAAGEDGDALKEDYKKLGYRLQCTEPMMVHSLKRIPDFKEPARTERVTTQAVADELAKAARSRQILPEHFAGDSPLRQYVARIDDEIVGWVRSVLVNDMGWCSNMFVKPEFRRRGIARSLLARMLREDKSRGAKAAVLMASHTGAMLYPVVGYEQIGTLYVFKLPRTARSRAPRK